ncbi:phosphate:acyl-[acyl carrier protein] acyltransferase [Pseudomonas duriflava]|uniref:Phosphate acyltransferase n=2 Tax=Pseudomonas duriflava TaxID=459528 RepID=A0A562Q9G6_9PSED|nr:phosphate:acyl-[acyl carrier protein] acyltransferase [Pseudomonas duriflava]
MGGDFGPRCIVPACISFLKSHPAVKLVLVGEVGLIRPCLDSYRFDSSRLHVQTASQVVGMAEKPSRALRGKSDSSMKVALDLVAGGQADACVSAGNTGALMAFARQTLRMLPGIERPAMYTLLPVSNGQCVLLDLGANLDCTAQHLYQFAHLGAAVAAAHGVVAPRVCLLNVGTEDVKGVLAVQQAAELLKASTINYAGFVEGDGVFRGEADVVVCDGFVGNVLLKSSEGLITMLLRELEAGRLGSNFFRMLAQPLLSQLKDEVRPDKRNGAGFLGLHGVVVKSHGNADGAGFQSALARAVTAVENDLMGRMAQQLISLQGGSAHQV